MPRERRIMMEKRVVLRFCTTMGDGEQCHNGAMKRMIERERVAVDGSTVAFYFLLYVTLSLVSDVKRKLLSAFEVVQEV
jgi:hypothetical protein